VHSSSLHGREYTEIALDRHLNVLLRQWLAIRTYLEESYLLSAPKDHGFVYQASGFAGRSRFAHALNFDFHTCTFEECEYRMDQSPLEGGVEEMGTLNESSSRMIAQLSQDNPYPTWD
jgi:hypothetical protein